MVFRSDPSRGPPACSIVVETENLAFYGIGRLRACLSSIGRQISAGAAGPEILVINQGKVPADLQVEIRAAFPQIRVVEAPEGLGYFGAKMHGAFLAGAEVVVLADSDCEYQDGWLEALLEPFGSLGVAVARGHTANKVRGPIDLAVRWTWLFPTHGTPWKIRASYHANNVAFRRSVLLAAPIPAGPHGLRAAAARHCLLLEKQGVAITDVPNARAWHPTPWPPPYLVTRVWMTGVDAVLGIRDRALIREGRRIGRLGTFLPLVVRGLARPVHMLRRIVPSLREDARRVFLAPLALPLAVILILVFWAGLLTEWLRFRPIPMVDPALMPSARG